MEIICMVSFFCFKHLTSVMFYCEYKALLEYPAVLVHWDGLWLNTFDK